MVADALAKLSVFVSEKVPWFISFVRFGLIMCVAYGNGDIPAG